MEFKDFSLVKVEEPNFNDIINKYKDLISRLNTSKSSLDAINIIKESFKLDDELSSNYTIASIRHTINVKDEYYSKLSDAYDMNLPEISEYSNEFNHAILDSKYKKEITNEFGTHFINKLELSTKTFSSEIIPDLQEENTLTSKYDQLLGSATAELNGKIIPITRFTPYLTSLDRNMRKEANKAFWKYYEEHDQEIGDIYDKLVHVRDKIAKKLGYKNFIQLAYYRLERLDYNAEDVKNYRDQIIKYVVPIANDLYKSQQKRINIQEMKYYDYALTFKDGNPKPIGTPKQLINKASLMYKKLNPTISYYFDFMVSHHCMDLIAKEGKVPGGYMTYIPTLQTSFIFSNFNGSSGDVDVLTHEFGHSLQGFLAGESISIPSLRSPGYECCEMHSMSMEFLTYPFMNLFFEKDTDKYCLSHLEDAIKFIPYGACIDAFQYFVYENPNISHTERKLKWRELEKIYTPHKQYGEDNSFLESGGFWMKQSHLFGSPFYYIDYTIAQVVSFEFFNESREDYDKTITKYLDFCKLGGLYPYKTLLKKANIKDPMIEGTIQETISSLKSYLNSFTNIK